MKRPSKYKNRKTIVDNITFASQKEADWYQDLKLRQHAKQISGLKLQPKFQMRVWPNGEVIGFYKADFEFIENGQLIVMDVKGFKTAIYKLKKKHVEAQFGITITEV